MIPHTLLLNINPALFSIAPSALNFALDPCNEVEVLVEGALAGEVGAAEVCGRVADAGALRPELMAFCAGEGAGAC